MKVVANGTRLALEMSQAETRQLVAQLTAALQKSEQVGGAWFAQPMTIEHQGRDVAQGRITFRVEG